MPLGTPFVSFLEKGGDFVWSQFTLVWLMFRNNLD